MRISIPLDNPNPYPVEMTTALKFDFVIEKIDFEVWGASSWVILCLIGSSYELLGAVFYFPVGPMDSDDDAIEKICYGSAFT